jgi:hypothetical protein
MARKPPRHTNAYSLDNHGNKKPYVLPQLHNKKDSITGFEDRSPIPQVIRRSMI